MCEATIGLIIDVGHSDLYFRVASLCFIEVQFCLSPCFFMHANIFFLFAKCALSCDSSYCFSRLLLQSYAPFSTSAL